MLVAGTYRAAASSHAGVGGSTDSSRFCNVRATLRSRSYREARSSAPAHRDPSVTSIDSSSAVSNRSSGATNTMAPVVRFMICSRHADDSAGTGPADQAGHQLACGDRLPCRGQFDRGKVRLVGSDGLFAHQLVVAVDEEQGAGNRTDPGGSVDERGAHNLVASRDRCDPPADLLERVERGSTARLPFEQNRGVERRSRPGWRDRR